MTSENLVWCFRFISGIATILLFTDRRYIKHQVQDVHFLLPPLSSMHGVHNENWELTFLWNVQFNPLLHAAAELWFGSVKGTIYDGCLHYKYVLSH